MTTGTLEQPEGETSAQSNSANTAATVTLEDKPLGEAGERALMAERDARKAADKRAKDADKRAADLERELGRLKQDSMSESEKAIENARLEARTSTVKELGERLARTEFKAAAAAKGVDVSDISPYIDMRQFIGDDGEPDVAQIEVAVAAFSPKQSNKPSPVSFDGGPRTPATVVDTTPAGLLAAAFAQDMRSAKKNH